MRVACSLMYTQAGTGGATPRLHTSGALSLGALADFGGAQHVLRCLRACPTRDAAHSLLAVLLDAAAEQTGLSRAECGRCAAPPSRRVHRSDPARACLPLCRNVRADRTH